LTIIKREHVVEALRKWRVQIELQNDVKVLTIRNDNDIELKLALNE